MKKLLLFLVLSCLLVTCAYSDGSASLVVKGSVSGPITTPIPITQYYSSNNGHQYSSSSFTPKVEPTTVIPTQEQIVVVTTTTTTEPTPVVTITPTPTPTPTEKPQPVPQSSIWNYWWLFLLVILLIIGVIIYLVIKD
jgi:hypothetical protein